MPRQNKPILPPGLSPIHFLGPPLSSGPLPAVFYFSLSAEESLSLDPFNQPALRFMEHGLRVFSITLPAHDGAFPHPHAMQAWAEDIRTGGKNLTEFLENCIASIDYLISEGWIDKHKIAVAGLSRGAYISFLLAARDQRIRSVLGFAPLTQFSTLYDIDDQKIHEFPLSDLKLYAEQLSDKKVKVYIGNNDTRVSTASCFAFIEKLTQSSLKNKHRPPPIEMVIYPSIGHKGHGTPPEVFNAGADWLAAIL